MLFICLCADNYIMITVLIIALFFLFLLLITF